MNKKAVDWKELVTQQGLNRLEYPMDKKPFQGPVMVKNYYPDDDGGSMRAMKDIIIDGDEIEEIASYRYADNIGNYASHIFSVFKYRNKYISRTDESMSFINDVYKFVHSIVMERFNLFDARGRENLLNEFKAQLLNN